MSREGPSTEGSPLLTGLRVGRTGVPDQDESGKSSLPRAALRAGRCFCSSASAELFTTCVHAHTVLYDCATASTDHHPRGPRPAPTRAERKQAARTGDSRARSVPRPPPTLSREYPDATHTHHPGCARHFRCRLQGSLPGPAPPAQGSPARMCGRGRGYGRPDGADEGFQRVGGRFL